jgi:hypothetical protein
LGNLGPASAAGTPGVSSAGSREAVIRNHCLKKG